MKILAVRGRNLNSLAGDFEIDLTVEPLRSAGLFAICGPTGSGKTTLLDAICLALYGQTPRVHGRGGVVALQSADENADARPASKDPRSLMRVGTAEAFAEVDFSGVDGGHYRARWSARRARGKTDGALQNVEITLKSLPDRRALGDGKNTSCHDEIAKRVGLSFDQFRRSVLLPQGDFEAFLKGEAEKRGLLLEKMTGTEIYTGISKAAHDRFVREKKELDELNKQLEFEAPLGEEARAQLDAERTRGLESVAALEARIREHGAAIAWYDALVTLEADEALARAEAERAKVAHAEAAPGRQELEEVRKARGVRAEVAAADAATRAAAEAAEARAKALARLARAEVALAPAEADLERARQEEAQVAREVEGSQVQLQEAAQLDARIGEVQPRLAQAEADLKAVEEELAKLRARHEEHQRELQEKQRLEKESADWLGEHEADRPLAEQWERWKRDLEELVEAGAACAGDETLARTLAADARAAADALAKAEIRSGEAAEQRRTVQAKIEAESAALDALKVDEARCDLARLDVLRGSLQELSALAKDLARTGSELEAATGRRDGARQAVEAAASGRKTLVAELPELELAEAQARRALEQVEAEQGLAADREKLVAGEPCPLCGSEEHPWAAGRAGTDERLAAAAREHDARRVACADHKQRLVELNVTEQLQEALREREARVVTQLAEERSELLTRWSEKAPAAGMPDVAVLPAPQAELAGRLAGLEPQRSAIQLTLTAAKGHEENLRELRKYLDKLGREQLAVEEKVAALRNKDADARSALTSVTSRLTTQRARQTGLTSGLIAHLPGGDSLRTALHDAPSAVLADFDRRVISVRERLSARQQAKEAIDKLQPQLARDVENIDAAREREAAASQRAIAQRAALAELRSARSAYFQGQSTEEVRKGHETRRETARLRREQAERARTATISEDTSAREAAARASSDVAASGVAVASSGTALEARLSEVGLTLDEVRRHLMHDVAWLAVREAELKAIDERQQQTATVLGERARKCAEHAGLERPACTRDEAAGRKLEAEQRSNAERETVASLVVKLNEDDRRRGVHGERSRAITDKLGRFAIWQRLKDLIGSSDGKRFRHFAQHVTLETLVHVANGHLEQLSTRYRLQPVPLQELELQIVDRDLGDDVRTVTTLSGGESFLISLALALALSSVSRSSTRLGSLFIDEGFGTLDQQHLDVAMDALEGLRERDRQVGIISHVAGLAEQVGVRLELRQASAGTSEVWLRDNAGTVRKLSSRTPGAPDAAPVKKKRRPKRAPDA